MENLVAAATSVNDSSNRQSLTGTQFLFFSLAVGEILSGNEPTLLSIRTKMAEMLDIPVDNISIKNTYLQLSQPNHAYPNAVGWLDSTPNPANRRENLLTLTKRGEEVALLIHEALSAA